MGFYRGCLDLWQIALQIDPQLFSPRAQRSLLQLHDQLVTFPLLLPQHDQLHELLGSLRAKFRAVASLLSVPILNASMRNASLEATSEF